MNNETFETIIVFPGFGSDRSENRRKRPPISLLPMATCVSLRKNPIQVIDGQSLGLPPKKLAEEVLKREPNILGLSVYTPAFPTALEVASIVKDNCPEIVTVFGGKHPTHRPQETLEHPQVDIVVVGEGEKILPEIVAARRINPDLSAMRDSLATTQGVGFKNTKILPPT